MPEVGVRRRRLPLAASVLSGVALVVCVLGSAAADEPAAPAPAPTPCDSWDVEYSLNANTKVTDTKMGGGDGTWPIGPGRVVLRFDNQNGAPGGSAKLIDYRLRSNFTVKANIVVASANVTADTNTVATPNACGISGEGTLAGKTLKWKGPWSGVHSDGTLTCDGGLCGKFGAPPQGVSPVHIAPHDVLMNPFDYADDRKTFSMAYAVVAKQSNPDSTSWVTLSGREMKRTCVVTKPCP